MASTNTLIKNLLNVKNTVVESAKNYTDGLRILVEFLQEIYIIFMMVGLRPIPLLLRTR